MFLPYFEAIYQVYPKVKRIAPLLLFRIALVAAIGAWLSACREFAPDPAPLGGNNDAVRNFEYFWRDVNLTYPFFEYDGVNWQQMYDMYRPKIAAHPTEDSLFHYMALMMDPLMDGHASLTRPRPGLPDTVWYNPDKAKYFNDFNIGVVMADFLGQDPRRANGKKIIMGEVTRKPGVLYFYIPSFENTGMASAIDSAVRAFGVANVRGVIVDVRNNPGGLIVESENVAGLFTRQTVPFILERFKNGPRSTDLTPPTAKSFAPFHGLWFTQKPVVLLTNRYSASASERLRLALKVLPNTYCVGDTTFGATSPIIDRTLPNNWEYVLVGSVTTDLDGEIYERRGIPPDLRKTNTLTDLRAGRDNALQTALDHIQ